MDEHTLNDLLECSVCLDRLNTSSKVLPCQHTFCRKCLEVIYESRQELRCPECRILVDTKIEDLPPNVLLMRILEGMKNAATKQQTTTQAQQSESSGKNETQKQTLNPTNPSTINNENAQHRQQHLRQNTANVSPHIQQQQYSQQMPTVALTPPQQQQQQQRHPVNQQRRCIVPHAYALYDFDSNEPTDLKFKKGDLILLRRKIDSNWYVGQLKGIEGNFPINYVQVVVPVPSSQCVALYDFKMGPNEEEGCLTFKKGTVIQVLRRVDQNWAEGRIGASIGIFPIAFVELNHMAKQLLENFASVQQHSTQNINQQMSEVRDLPPIPVADPSVLAPNESAMAASSITGSSSTTTAQLSCSSSSNSSATTSPTSTTANPSTSCSTTTSSSNTIFHSMPNSPQSSMPTTPQHSAQISNASNSVRMRNDLKHKRHSLNALLNNGSALSIMQSSNRHSAEILSVPNDFEPDLLASSTSTATGQTTAAREQQHHLSSTNISQKPQGLPNQTQQASNATQSSIVTSSTTPRHNVLCVQQNVPPSLPWGYLALYPYKPRKNDELELKKGCVYMVTERCLDGWFKGKNWKDISGVFPGNYVTPLRARDQQQLMHSWKLIPPSNCATITTTSQMGNQAVSGQQAAQQLSNYSPSMRNDLENINARLTLANLTPHQAMPPDLPPRQLAISPPNVSAMQPQSVQQQVSVTSKETRDKEALKEKPTSTGCIPTSSSSSSSSSSTATSSASAGLKKFLTHIKSRSKSPGAAIVAASALATAQLQFNDATGSSKQTQVSGLSGGTLTPVHVRSGSCPSQILQSIPNDRSRTHNENKDESPIAMHQQQHSPQTGGAGYGSQRIKATKERASLENSRPTIDSTLRSLYANHIQQQSNLMPKKCAQQHQQTMPQSSNINFNSPPTTTVIHRKSHSLDASNILQSSPGPTSSALAGVALSGNVIKSSIPQCNINAAAIHASATTNNSPQNAMTESRFRCVVPYPPNSDVELELQVGDIIYVYRKQKNGWYKGTNSRTYKTGLFPASFVEPDL
ncbi:E3 ubiquitin-protein ligase SH3RF1 [Stomoxys calcitrans]|uniref:RING-type E3 ubiquitin transferase n=1 Tax=Stomoxys calcitrans TaxID=35570 RepID=A0A1I8Q5B1_STOCA|nr:E3 ubiquitin-protein ligase SH3RF1 [Stomoxys calcitrans]